jgi:pimeloyl-ACP methyl ester carboxylesterase
MPLPNAHAARCERVTDAGANAPWLTLVHAMAQDRRVFSAQVPVFRERFRLLLVDLPGHGRSADLPGPYGLAEYAAAVLAALGAAGVTRTHWWGTHTGAGVGLLLAAELGTAQPELLASLVLEGPVMPGRLPRSAADMLAAVGTLAREQGMAAARRHWWEASDWFAVIRDRPEECRAAEQRALLEDFPGGPWLDDRPPTAVAPPEAALADLHRPVLIVNGEHDLPDFLAAAEELTDLLPDARRALIPAAGGFPAWEEPDAVNAVVRGFLSEVTSH